MSQAGTLDNPDLVKPVLSSLVSVACIIDKVNKTCLARTQRLMRQHNIQHILEGPTCKQTPGFSKAKSHVQHQILINFISSLLAQAKMSQPASMKRNKITGSRTHPPLSRRELNVCTASVPTISPSWYDCPCACPWYIMKDSCLHTNEHNTGTCKLTWGKRSS